MDANESLNNFDYEGFMTREFSYPEGKFPDITRLLGHFDINHQITSGMCDTKP